MKTSFIVLVVVAIIAIIGAVFLQILENQKNLNYNDLLNLTDQHFVSVKIKNFEIKAEIARSNAKKKQGLSAKQKLNENEGMLFIFESVGNYGFWMKGMLFNIDIIFIKDNQIVDIAENMPYSKSENNIAIASSKEKANLVLEVNSGLVKKYNIKVGDKVLFFK